MKSIRERFEEKVIPEPMSGCWLWTGALFNAGYGLIRYRGKNVRANRLSYELHYGPISAGEIIRHTCDNRACVNPHHLLAGTYQDNANDAIARDRVAFGKNSARTKLTEEQVKEIRRRRESGETLVSIAKSFGIGHAQVRSIQLRQSWRRLT